MPAGGRPSAGAPLWPWLLAAALAVLASIWTFDPKLYINGDNAEYLAMAARVLAGDLWPSEKYPPLFPYLLAPLRAAFGTELLPYKILVLLCFGGAAFALAPVFRTRLPGFRGAALLFAALTAVPVLEFSHYVMSEIPFLFALAGTLVFADRVTRNEERAAQPLRDCLRDRSLWGLALCLAAGFYLRSAGAAVVAGVGAALLLRRSWGAAAALAVLFGALALPWAAHSLAAPGGNPYFRQFLLVNPYYPDFGAVTTGSFATRVWLNVVEYFREIIPLSVLPIPYRSTYTAFEIQRVLLPWPIAALITGLLLIGLLQALWKKDPLGWSVAMSLLLVLAWPPVWAGSRFLVPLVPLFFLLVARGAGVCDGLARNRGLLRASLRRVLGSVLLGFLLVVAIVSIVRYEAETRAYPKEWANYFRALEWLRGESAPDDLIIDRKSVFAEWVTGRRARSFPRESDVTAMRTFLTEAGADWIVYPSLPYDDIQRYLTPAVSQLQDHLTVAAVFGGDPTSREPLTFVFRFHPEGAPQRR